MAPMDPSAFLPSQVQLMPIYKVSSTSISLTLIRTMLNLRVLHPEIFVGGHLIKSCRDRQISESDSHRDIDIGLPTGLTMIPSIHHWALAFPFDIHRQE